MKHIKIILAEDQQLIREALVALLNDQPDFIVTGQAGNGKELLDLMKRHEPDIVLLDIDMPVMNGYQSLEIIKKRFPEVKVIMLTLHTEYGFMNEFMTKGASAYLSKNIEIDLLFHAINSVYKNGAYFNDEVSNALLSGLRKEKSIHPFFDEQALTPKELVILKALCDGMTNKVIAEVHHISINTVDFHRGNIYTKTKSKNIAELVKYAIRNELVSV